jgi:DNA polymerase-3 subunit delta'
MVAYSFEEREGVSYRSLEVGMSFNDIIGHETIISQIDTMINSGRFSHAHLIVGEDGLGKSIIAKEISLKLLGKTEDRSYVDILEWRVGKNKQSIGVDEIRDIIKEVNKKPYEGDRKIVIIYEAHKMTMEAQNAFLKTIEEPPKGVTIILLSEGLDLMLETIKSRCQVHKLNRLNIKDIMKYLKREYPDLEERELKQVISFIEGVPGRSKIFLEDEDFKGVRNKTIDILLELCNKDRYMVKKYEEFFDKNKDLWREILSCLVSYIRDIVIYKEIGKDELVINNDKIEEVKKLSNIYSLKELDKMIKEINNTKESLDRRVNAELAFDIMLLNMQEV